MANYWDTIKNAIASKIGEGLSAVGENVAAGFAGSFAGRIAPGADTTQVSAAAAAPIRQAGKRIAEPLVNIAAKPAETIKADALFNLGIQEATDLYELVWPKVTRPIATAALTTKQLGRFEIPNIPANYELAKNIGPGQAAFSDVPLLFNKEFNIADPTDRKETFEKNIFGKVVTGSADGLLSWYLDPLFVAGKGLALGRKGLLIKPIEKAEDIVNLRKDLDQQGLFVASAGQAGRETPIGTAVSSLVGKSITEISSHPLIRKSTNPRLLTALISESKTYDEAADFIAAAAGVFLGLQFMVLIPPPYNLGLPIGAAGFFAALVWFFL